MLPHRDAEQSGVLYTALAFGKPIVMSDVGGFAEVARTGAGSLVPAGRRRCAGRAADGAAADPEERERLAAAAAAAAAGRTPGSRRRARRWRSTRSSARDDPRRRLLGLRGPARLHPPRLPGAPVGPRSVARRWASPTGDEPLPRVSLIVAAHDEEDVIERKVRDRARARLSARAAGGDRRLGRLDRPHGGARPGGGRGSGAGPPARGQGRGAERRRGEGERGGPRLLGRQQHWGPDALVRLVAPLGDPKVGYVCGQVRFDGRARPTRRASTGATRWRSGNGSPASRA